MKDLGTVPVMAYALPGLRAFYPDGAWWTPCLMECSDRLLQQAETLGIDASFCPVRAMLAAFQNGEHFPLPDLLVCSTGAVCDDFSAIAQRLEQHGLPDPLVGNAAPPRAGAGRSRLRPAGRSDARRRSRWIACARNWSALRQLLGELAGQPLDDATLCAGGIRAANQVRRLLARACAQTVYAAPGAPLPALEMLIAEMLAIHFCSDREETIGGADGPAGRGRSRASRQGQFVVGRGRRARLLGQSRWPTCAP